MPDRDPEARLRAAVSEFLAAENRFNEWVDAGAQNRKKRGPQVQSFWDARAALCVAAVAFVKERIADAVTERCAPLVEAAAELVRLKDGPRGDAYREAKEPAWQALRDALARFRGADG